MAIDLAAVSAAIEGTRAGLDAAGFGIECDDREGRLFLVVQAKEGACEDCLVPKPVFASIVGKELSDAGLAITDFEVVYPVEAGDGVN